MSERKLKEALTKYSGDLTFMSFTADQPEGTSVLSNDQNRACCVASLKVLKSCWTRDKHTIEQIEELTIVAVEAFGAGDYRNGRLAVRSIDEILWGIRMKK